jgi:hypothetical protein
MNAVRPVALLCARNSDHNGAKAAAAASDPTISLARSFGNATNSTSASAISVKAAK